MAAAAGSEEDLENTVIPDRVRARGAPRSPAATQEDLEETKVVRSAAAAKRDSPESAAGLGFAPPFFTGGAELDPGEGHPGAPPPERPDSPQTAAFSPRQAATGAGRVQGARKPPPGVPQLPLGSEQKLDAHAVAFLTAADAENDEGVEVVESRIWHLTLGVLVCVTTFTFMTLLRLELRYANLWPLYFDFLPLWLLPCILFLFAIDFARNEIEGVGAALARGVVIATSFLSTVMLVFLGVFVCLRINGLVDWSWCIVTLPLWPIVLVGQVVLVFLTPGFLRAGQKWQLFLYFGQLWGGFYTALTIGLKLDDVLEQDFGKEPWYKVFLPFTMMLFLQAMYYFIWSLDRLDWEPDTLEEGVHDMLAVLFFMFLALRLDMTITWSWIWVFSPLLVNLLWSLYHVLFLQEFKNEEKLNERLASERSSRRSARQPV